MPLLYIDQVQENQSTFEQKVNEIAKALGINPDWLMIIFMSESGINSKIKNSIGATGLIQFLPSTAISLGTTTDALQQMTNVEQLDYVYKYFAPYAGRINDAKDLYLITFFPAAIGKADDWVLQTSTLPASTIASQNKGIDLNGDGQITVGEFKQWVQNKLPVDALPDEAKDPTEIQKYIAYTKQPTNWGRIGLIIVALIALFYIGKKVFKVSKN